MRLLYGGRATRAIVLAFCLCGVAQNVSADDPPLPVSPTLPMSIIGKAALISHSTAVAYYGANNVSTDGLAKYTLKATPAPPEIVEMARALKGNIDLIYAYVRNNIRVSWMYGMQKGGLGALIDKAGTPFDQADLMLKLLRQSNVAGNNNYYTVSYRSGTITLTGAQFMAWTGISDSNAACQLLANGGIPGSVNGSTNMVCGTGPGVAISGVTMDHIWLRVVISADCHTCGQTGTFLFDPSYKPYSKTAPGFDLRAAAQMVSGTALSDSGIGMGSTTLSGIPAVNSLNSIKLNDDLKSWSQNLLNYLYANQLQNAQMEDVVGGGVIVPDQPPPGGWRQALLPYPTANVLGWSCDSNSSAYCGVPDKYRTTLGLLGYMWNENMDGTQPPPQPKWDKMFDLTQGPTQTQPALFVDQIYGRRLTVDTDYPGIGSRQYCTVLPKYCTVVTLDLDGVPLLAPYVDPALNYNYTNPYGYPLYATSRGSPTYISLIANHPYAAAADGTPTAAGNYMDETVTRPVVLITSLTIVDGFGDTSGSLFNRWSEESAGDSRNGIATYTCAPPRDGLCGNKYPGGTGDFEREKMAAYWLGQNTRAAQLHAAIGNSVVQLHHELGFAFGDTWMNPTYQTLWDTQSENPVFPTQDNVDRLDVDSAFSVEHRVADAKTRREVIQSIAASSATLEGSVNEQMSSLPDSSSTATRFEWGNAPPGTAGNWDAPTCGSLNAYEDPGCPGSTQGGRAFLQYISTTASLASGLAFVEAHPANSYSPPSQVAIADRPPAGFFAGEWQSAYSSEIGAYFSCGTSCGTPGNLPFSYITTSQEAELGPGQRGGSFQFYGGNLSVCAESDELGSEDYGCGLGYGWFSYTFTPTEQRGPAFVAMAYDSNGDPVAIAHDLVSLASGLGGGPAVVTKGGGGSAQKHQDEKYSPGEAADILKSRFVDKSNALGVNLANGSFSYTMPAKLDVGNGGFPYELTAEMQWHPAPFPINTPPVSPIAPPPGWTSNWNNNLSQSGSGLEAMGKSDVRAAVGTIAAFLAEQDLYGGTPSTQRDVAALLTQAWWDHQMSGNVVTVSVGSLSRQFLALPQGVTLPTGEQWINTGGGYAKLVMTNTRAAYEYIDPSAIPRPPYAISRGWDYTGSKTQLPVSFTVINANGDQQVFTPWSNKYQTNDYDYAGFAQGLRLSKWTFPQGVTICFNYGNPSGANAFDVLTQVYNVFNTASNPHADCQSAPVRAINFQYNGGDARTASFDNNLASPDKRSVTLGFTADRLAASVTDPAGAITTFVYGGDTQDALQRPTPWEKLFQIFTPETPKLPNLEYDYDALGHVKQVQDAEALQNKDRAPYQFLIADGTRGERDDPLGAAWSVDYDVYGHPARYTDELGHITLAAADGRGQIAQYIYPEGDQELFQYDDHGNTTQLTKVPKPSSCTPTCPANIVIAATWDQGWNKIASLTDALNKTTNFQYFASGNGASELQWARRPAVNGTRPEYDFTYDPAGKVLTSSDPVDASTSIVTTNAYDSAENLLSTIVDPGTGTHQNLKTTFSYDSQSNVAWTSDPVQNANGTGGTTTFIYDADRRKTESDHHIGSNTGTLNAASKTVYDPVGRDVEDDIAKCFDSPTCSNTGSVPVWIAAKKTTYTPTSKVASVTDADGAVTSTTYDAADRTYVATDPALRQTQFAYDAAGNVLSEIRGLGTPAQAVYATYTYGADGERLSVADALGATHLTSYAYDGFNRLATTTYPDATTDKITLYDANSNIKTSVNRAGQSFTYGYDALNRQTSKIVPAYGTVLANTIATQYDLGGRVKQISDTPGNLIADGYDSAGRVTSVATTIAGLTGAMTTQYTLDPNSNRTRLTWPDGYAVNYGYDTLDQMKTATDSAGVALGTYTYDALSRRTNLAYGNGMSTAYTYSNAGDLLTLNHTTNGVPHFTYTYTPAHQLLTDAGSNANYVWQPSTATSDSYAAVNALNQYPSVNGGSAGGTDCQGHAQAYSYDCTGNLTGDGTWSYLYDPENHMITASKSGTSASYAYDPLGRREMKTVGAAVTNFLDDGGDEIAEYDGSGTVQRRFVPGPGVNQPIAMVTGNGGTLARQYFRTNHQGSIIDSENDAGTRVEGPIRYDPFGNCFPAGQCNATTPYRFAGMRFDPETGTYQDRARVYGPSLARFFQVDPVGYKDDLNLYTYAGNDSTNETDPTGLYVVTPCAQGDDSCTAAQTKFEQHRQDDMKSKDADVSNAAKAWGDLGQDNHVSVTFASQSNVNGAAGALSGQVASDNLTPGSAADHTPVITVLISASMNDYHQMIAHNGSHIEDDLNFLNSYASATGKYDASKNFTVLQTETKAYRTGGMVQSYSRIRRGGEEDYVKNAYKHWSETEFAPEKFPQ